MRATMTNTSFSIQIFYPETTDVYDRKNMPKVIYCIHALRYWQMIFFLPHSLCRNDYAFVFLFT